ncbi:MAG: hypothetical protein ACXVZI_09515 [Terriglobales bacterium]
MKRFLGLIVLLAVSVWGASQAAPSGGAATGSMGATPGMAGSTTPGGPGATPGMAGSTAPSTTGAPTGTNGAATQGFGGTTSSLNTSTGTAFISAPASIPIVVTPELHLGSTVTAVGATNATPGNTAGAMTSTAQVPVSPRVITTVPQFSFAGASVVETLPPQQTTVATTPSFNSGVGIVGNASLFDRGVGSGSSLVAGGNLDGRSLGEVARENRQQVAGANAHTYTNQDIDRINAQPGTNVGGLSGAAVGAGNATGTQQQNGNMPAVSQPITSPAPAPGVSQPVPPSNSTPPRDQSQVGSPGGTQMAQAIVPSNPADQDQSPANNGRLPASGSILPLTALVGFLAAGAGLLSR